MHSLDKSMLIIKNISLLTAFTSMRPIGRTDVVMLFRNHGYFYASVTFQQNFCCLLHIICI
jgi:hypothetical protein